MWLLKLGTVAILFVFPLKGVGMEKFAGPWEMTSMTFGVKVESWGENCGPRPVSYTSKKVRPVDIAVRGNHLLFSSGGMRTDRCGSPNPKLRSISKKVSSGLWKTVCETDDNDPKYERGVYMLKAKGDDKLEYLATSKFDWTLKGDHCIAVSEERRTFRRVDRGSGALPLPTEEAKPEPQPVEEEPSEVPAAPDSEGGPRRKLDDVEPWCDTPGPAKKIVIHPPKFQLGPGEKVCFKALAIDEEGCRTPVRATWTATQNNRIVRGPMSSNGCFSAGDTAADAEGNYSITARVGSKSDTAEVSVIFPDLGELFAARLRPLQDFQPEQKTQNENDPSPVVPATPSATVSPGAAGDRSLVPSSVQEGDESGIFWVILGLLAVAFAGFTAVIVIAIRRRDLGRREISDSVVGFLNDSNAAVKFDEESRKGGGKTEPQPSESKVSCPNCGRQFPTGARFCPHDRSPLNNPEQNKNELIITGSRNSAGMVCPNCHRGYDETARFCPHDSARLVPYVEWRKTNKIGRHEKMQK